MTRWRALALLRARQGWSAAACACALLLAGEVAAVAQAAEPVTAAPALEMPAAAQRSVTPATPATMPAPPAAPKAPAAQVDTSPAPVSLDPVEVRAAVPSATEERRQSTASKMVFGREELDRYGDTSVGDVLKRLPGVTISGTPGRGGDIRMRGLGNGYTQILLNGEPAPRGFSLDTLSPDQIERIEITRAPVAEHSARAIAGTINLVLRGDVVRTGSQFRPNLGWESGHAQPGVSLQHDDRSGRLAWSAGFNASHRDLASESETTTTGNSTAAGSPDLLQREHDTSRSRSDRLQLFGRLNWRLGGGDTLSLQPFLSTSRGRSDGSATLDQPLGLRPPPFAFGNSAGSNDSRYARLGGNLKVGLPDGGRLEWRIDLNQARSDNRNQHLDFDAGGLQTHVLASDAAVRDSSASTTGSYARTLGEDHALKLGLELEQGRRSEDNNSLQDGRNPLASFGGEVAATTRRTATYAQDEWDVDPLWSVYAGVRWEQIRTDSSTLGAVTHHASQVASPLLHSVWRFSDKGRDQLRLALTRSYRAPTLGNLVALPVLASNYPVSGSNTAASPDSTGNPSLRPELAWGLDAAFEHDLGQGGLVSVSAFQRTISDLIRNIITLQTVSWSQPLRWVSTPENIGHAVTRGIELEAKFRLDEWIPEAPRVDVRSNYSHFWSSVDGVPGPDNRLDQQPRDTGNLGLDYRLKSLPLTVGGSFNWTAPFTAQETVDQFHRQGIKRELDLYGLWRFDPNTQLRISLSNLTHSDYLTADGEQAAGQSQYAETRTRSYPSISARFELRF